MIWILVGVATVCFAVISLGKGTAGSTNGLDRAIWWTALGFVAVVAWALVSR
jgi:hypothetical protein